MIDVQSLTKRYGERVAVDGLSFRAEPGVVTGFLGPNGSGKSTTMRMILGLDRPTSGRATVGGRPYAEHAAPLHEVGALLDASAVHPGRTARAHLSWLAATHGLPARRVDEVLELVGLSEVAGRRAGRLSLGMGQRLGIAAALLGDPRTVVLDEPVNGLDPEGVRWIRELLRGLAADGRTVLVSSHLMSEMAQTADRLVVIGRGRLIADTTVAALVRDAAGVGARVRCAAPDRLGRRLRERGAEVHAGADGLLVVRGVDAPAVGDAALASAVAIHELTPLTATLEDAFMALTADSVEYHAGARTDADDRMVVR
ncbi:ABC transporter ATP-binding protein [Patulibacter americanus]|uniref:ABC transporter ATP-binding protein n=1 Tax=Patulibacter americanus TaxID=588672 RepID=UPI0003B39B73|nr:ATP-binding cassette domain-containing protein [Patulibacter americanus]